MNIPALIKSKLIAGLLSRKLWFCFPCEIAATVMCIISRPGTAPPVGLISGGEWVTITTFLAGIYVTGNVVSKFSPTPSAPDS